MSGGSFDYKEWHIENIADDIQHILERQGKEIPEDERWGSLETYETYSEEVQKIMKDGVDFLRKAYIYSKRIDYFLAGDDGEESLVKRLKFELDKLEELKRLES